VSYLLDTNVVSEAREPDGNPHVRAWLATVRGDELFLSVLVLGEIQHGIERLRRRDPGQAGCTRPGWLPCGGTTPTASFP
jgi:toxin FitB